MQIELGLRSATQLTGSSSSQFQWLQCDACEQQRRVDNATFRLFHNDTWNGDAFARRRRELLAAFPILEHRLRDWLMHLHGEQNSDKDNAVHYLCGDKVNGFLDHRNWLQRIRREHARGFDELLAEEVVDLDVIMTTAYAQQLASWKEQDTGPQFTCDMLSNCTCEEPCDWKQCLAQAEQ